MNSDTPAQPLSNRDIDLALRNLPGWSRQDGGLRRRFRLAGFGEAIRFVNDVARLAGEADHYPNIDIRYRNVSLFLTTHDAGGVTQFDLDLAAQINGLDSPQG